LAAGPDTDTQRAARIGPTTSRLLFIAPIVKQNQIINMENSLRNVQTAFKIAFGVDPESVTIATTPKDVPAWDSMGHVALVSALEQVFGLNFDVD
jgi:acyl carrier protein